MIEAKDAVVWINKDDKSVKVARARADFPLGWGDPIGAHYSQWRDMTDEQRSRLMTETAIDLAMSGFDLETVLREFFKVDIFRALGSESFPMCRALTKAIVGRSLEFNTMPFEELLVAYGRKAQAAK